MVSSGSFSIRAGQEFRLTHRLSYVPNAVYIFGCTSLQWHCLAEVFQEGPPFISLLRCMWGHSLYGDKA